MDLASNPLTIFVCVLLVAVAGALLYCCYTAKTEPAPVQAEKYTDYEQMMAHEHNEQEEQTTEEESFSAPSGGSSVPSASAPSSGPSAAEPLGQNESPLPLDGSASDNSSASVPKDCFPKDQLAPQDLLPTDTNSTWAQVNPAGQGNIGDNNLLTAGHHVGINTVGQTLRNANLQLRSEPPNPQMKVSPWMQSTIEPDTNRRPMEIS